MRSFWTSGYDLELLNNYGPWQHVEKSIPRQIKNLIDGQRPQVYGAGLNVRDWIHVDDHSSAVWTILNQGQLGETYLIGADGERSNLDVVRLLLAHFDRPEEDIEWYQANQTWWRPSKLATEAAYARHAASAASEN